jgi:polar amino acid transport system ATP-binding protein
MLEVRGLTHVYAGTSEGVHALDLDIPREHVFAILGRSGAGKTTLLNCLGRFLRPQAGTITLDGADIHAMTELAFRQAVGTVFQALHLFPHLTVRENITLSPVRVLGVDERTAGGEADSLLETFGLAGLGAKFPSEISGGQAQRVALARAMILKPSYLLLDEPTAALDLRTTAEFGAFLRSLTSETTFVIVTHDVAFVEEVGASGVLMEGGRITAHGGVAELAARLARS